MPFALITYTRIEDPHAAQVNLDNSILPRVKLHVEGLQKAYFTADDSYSNGLSLMVFATRDQAEAMADRVNSGEAHPSPGVTFDHCEVREIVGEV